MLTPSGNVQKHIEKLWLLKLCIGNSGGGGGGFGSGSGFGLSTGIESFSAKSKATAPPKALGMQLGKTFYI
ncbi:hypothetical protein SO802_018380 [Lithocarpus litseifolius]|uniref:Uncharacterized protein n=1 Tax=Lithocarpus litseifolius TaxID=425828 RepID=A0AAW2CMZ2_9ROSI